MAEPAESRGGLAARFPVLLTVIVLVGVALRVVYVLAVTRHDTDLYDATYYELQARDIADGQGFFEDPFALRNDGDDDAPAADHPPLLVFALLPAALIDDTETSRLWMRFTTVALGAATIVAVALLARRVAGPETGLLAGGIAAVDPNLWMIDGLLMPETLAGLLSVGVVAGTYRLARAGPSPALVVGLGVACGLATLARAELVLLAPLVVAVGLWRVSRGDVRRFAGLVLGAAAGAGMVVAPWVAFNLARFERPVFVSTGDGLALAAANCDSVYHGRLLGWAEVFEPCVAPPGQGDQSVWNDRNREDAIDHVTDNLDRVPVVVAARLGRAFHVYRVGQTATFAAGEGRPVWASHLGAVATWLLLPLAAGGAVVLRRRGEWVWPLVVPIVVAAGVVGLLAGGLPRYRAPAEPLVVVLAAVAVAAVITRIRMGGARSGDPGLSTARSADRDRAAG